MSLFSVHRVENAGKDIIIFLETNDQHGVHLRPAAALLNSLRIEAQRHQITIALRVRMQEIDIGIDTIYLALMKIETREPFEVLIRNIVEQKRDAIAQSIIDTLTTLT